MTKVTPKKGMPPTQMRSVDSIKLNEENPRWIPDDAFEKLKKSIVDFPEMLALRPIVVDERGIILGGNMRYRAAVAIGMQSVPVLEAQGLSEEQKSEFVIKDNVSAGFWDHEILSNLWDELPLDDWGLDVDYYKTLDQRKDDDSEDGDSDLDNYTRKIEPPIYTPSEICPEPQICYDVEKYQQILEAIESASVSPEQKMLLRLAATRHIKFNYDLIADYYSHQEHEMQELMEDSALVIIDLDSAIEKGFVRLTQKLLDARGEQDELE